MKEEKREESEKKGGMSKSKGKDKTMKSSNLVKTTGSRKEKEKAETTSKNKVKTTR